MTSVNKVILVGRLGRDPETRYLTSGKAVTNFSIATSYKRQGEEQTEWHRCTCFDRVAEIVAEFVRKGDLLYIEGSIRTEKYQDRDGVERQATNIIVNQVQMLNSKAQQLAPAERQAQRQQNPPAPVRNEQQPIPGGYNRYPSQQQAPQQRTSNFDDLDDVPF